MFGVWSTVFEVQCFRYLLLKLSCGFSLLYTTKVHLELNQISMIGIFAKIINDFQPLIRALLKVVLK